MKKTIKNRSGRDISVLVENVWGLRWAILVHGLRDKKESKEFDLLSESLQKRGYTVIRFDLWNSDWQSYWNPENATFSNCYEDLEDIVSRAVKQTFYCFDFLFVGHSLWAMVSLMYAHENPDRAHWVVLYNPTSSKEAIMNSPKINWADWQKRWYVERESISKPGTIKRLNYSFIEDLEKFDFDNYKDLPCPLLQLSSKNNEVIWFDYQKEFFDGLYWPKSFCVLESGGHNLYWNEIEPFVKAVEKFVDENFVD